MNTAAFFALFAQTRSEPFLRKTEDWVVVGLLVGTLLAAAGVLWLVERWRKRAVSGGVGETASELTGFRAMFDRGEITEDEYNRLKQRVAGRAKPPQVSPTPTPAPPTTPDRSPLPPPTDTQAPPA